jgi:hypothetical protein
MNHHLYLSFGCYSGALPPWRRGPGILVDYAPLLDGDDLLIEDDDPTVPHMTQLKEKFRRDFRLDIKGFRHVMSACKHDLANHAPARIVHASQPLKFWSAEEVALVALFQVACIILFGDAYCFSRAGTARRRGLLG